MVPLADAKAAWCMHNQATLTPAAGLEAHLAHQRFNISSVNPITSKGLQSDSDMHLSHQLASISRAQSPHKRVLLSTAAWQVMRGKGITADSGARYCMHRNADLNCNTSVTSIARDFHLGLHCCVTPA